MATIQEAKAQLKTARQQVKVARQSFKAQREALPTGATQRELRQRRDGLKSQLRRRKLGEARSELELKEKGLGVVERKITEQEKLVAEAEEAQRVAEAERARQQRFRELVQRVATKGDLPMGTTKSEAREVQKFIDENPDFKSALDRREVAEALTVVTAGKVTPEAQSRAIEAAFSEKQLKSLRKMGFIQDVGPQIQEVTLEPEKISLKKPSKLGFTLPPPEELDKGKEVFKPRMKAFVKPSRTGERATAQFRPATPKELTIQQRLKEMGSFQSVIAFPERIGKKIFGTKEPPKQTKLDVRFRKLVGEPQALPKFATKPFDIAAKGLISFGEFAEKEFKKEVRRVVPPKRIAEIKQIPGVKELFETKVSRREAEKFVSETLKLGTLLPAGRVGTAQRTESIYEYDVIKGKFRLKKNLRDILEDPIVEIRGDKKIVRDLTNREKIELSRRLYEEALDDKTRANVLKNIEKSYGKSFLKDFVEQEGIAPAGVRQLRKREIFSFDSGGQVAVTRVSPGTGIQPPATIGPPRPSPVVRPTTPTPGTLEEVSPTFTLFRAPTQITSLTPDVTSKKVIDFKPTSELDTKSESDVRVIPRLDFSLGGRTTTISRQDTKTKQDVKTVLKPLTTPVTSPGQSLQQFLRPQRARVPGRGLKRPLRPATKVPVRAKLPDKFRSLAERIETSKFKIFARKKGKDVQVGTARTSKEAFTKLKTRLKSTILASGFVTKDKKKIKPTFLLGGEFRPSKVDPFRVVQRKTKRLGTRQETGELQFFRKLKGKKPRRGLIL